MTFCCTHPKERFDVPLSWQFIVLNNAHCNACSIVRCTRLCAHARIIEFEHTWRLVALFSNIKEGGAAVY